ncbi:hypothetical protein ASPCAL10065 [Aspergillus calidoustus]|uniref:Uncharacterized protein n=1 Tax=Aspergillus calidoustus TaxID=454130 RepID=A0A0U5G586_ASPCI|nr:hypothetical protein ASPCAL10065 [Aspergillus calidoustus]
MAARDTSSPLTSSGILTCYSHDDHLNCPDWIYDCADSGSLMKHALQPKCCPMYLPFAPSFRRRLFDTTIDGPMGSSGIVANSSGVCIPVDPNYAVSKGCQGHEAYSYQYARTVYTYTNGSTTGVTAFNSPTSTFSDMIPVPTSFKPEELSEYRRLHAVDAISLLSHESDLQAAATATATATADTGSGTPGTSKTTSNAAGSLRRKSA